MDSQPMQFLNLMVTEYTQVTGLHLSRTDKLCLKTQTYD